MTFFQLLIVLIVLIFLVVVFFSRFLPNLLEGAVVSAAAQDNFFDWPLTRLRIV